MIMKFFLMAICIPFSISFASDLGIYEDDLLKFGEKNKSDIEQEQDGLWAREQELLEKDSSLDTSVNNEQKKENQGAQYSDLGHSLIQWKKIDLNQWVDFNDWKREREVKDRYPKWMISLKSRQLIELVGRVLDCVGNCRNFRGNTFANVQFKSSIKEGDEFTTGKDSFAWLFLMDGSLIRVSPQSSISFKEINISHEKIFFHARVNYGNVLWLSRIPEKLKEFSDRETDTLFLPLNFFEANFFPEYQAPKEEDLYSYLIGQDLVLRQYKYLNKLITDNNELTKNRKSEFFLVLPNGTFHGENLQIEMVVLNRGKSFIKNRSFHFYNPESLEVKQPLTYFYRGYINRDTFDVPLNQWLEISEDGKSIIPYEKDDPNFSFGEYLTKRIPTIFVARELLLQEYSKNFFTKELNEEILAKENYRLWNGKDKVVENELGKRLEFLKEYTRREESTTLRISERFQEIIRARGEPIGATPYSDEFYSLAVNHFIQVGNLRKESSSDREILNSTQKRFWELIHARRNDKK